MPIYTYRCNDCELIFDTNQALMDNHDACPCPVCDQPCDRVWTTPVVIFRGYGFTLAAMEDEESMLNSEDGLITEMEI